MSTSYPRGVKLYTELNVLQDFLKTQGYRQTGPRKTIQKAFLECDGHLHADELHEKSNKLDRSIGIATVYRTIALLKKCGLANEHTLPGGKKVIEKLYRKSHHDHFFCTQCRSLEEFEHPLIEKYQEEIAKQYKFFLQSHHMMLYGICKQCK